MFAREADLSGGRQFPQPLHRARPRRDLDLVDHRRALSARRRASRTRCPISGETRPRRALFDRRRRDQRRRVARSDQLRRRAQAADRVSGAEQRLGDLDAAVDADGDRRRRRQGGRLRIAGHDLRRHRSDRDVPHDEGRDGARAQRRRPDPGRGASAIASSRTRPTTTTARTATAKTLARAARPTIRCRSSSACCSKPASSTTRGSPRSKPTCCRQANVATDDGRSAAVSVGRRPVRPTCTPAPPTNRG